MSRRIHRVFPEKQEAAASWTRPNAFQPRPFASARSKPTVQRYTVVQPNDYEIAAENAGQLFPSQHLDQTRTTAESEEEGTKITQRLSWVNRFSNNPPLKVSAHGKLAVESTVGQPKVFYGEAETVAASRKRLIDIGSRVTLKPNPTETLHLPRDPDHIDQNVVSVVQVEPERSPDVSNDEELMDANECNSVSKKIVRGQEALIGNTGQGFVLGGEATVQGGAPNQIATAIRTTQGIDPLNQFPQRRQQAAQALPNIHLDQTLPISKEAQEYFANGLWRRQHLVPDTQVLRALSLPGVPEGLWKQIYDLHVGKQENQRPHRGDLLNHIKNVLLLQQVQKYQTIRSNVARHQRLGVNEYAEPEVGESFSTLAQTSPQVIDDDGVFSHDLDFSTLSGMEVQGAIDKLFALKNNSLLLGKLAKSEYANAHPGLVPFQEHHAAVVAKDGADTVTFENYNRAAETDTRMMELWNALFQEFDAFDDGVSQELVDVRGLTQQAKANPNYDPIDKLRRITEIRKAHLEGMREQFVEVQAGTVLKLETNLGENKNDLWHFNMYGPAQKQQSFHQVWSQSIANAVTVRSTSRAEGGFKDALAEKIRRQAEDLATEEMSAIALLWGLLDPIRQASTRVEASVAYRAALKTLEERSGVRLEENYD